MRFDDERCLVLVQPLIAIAACCFIASGCSSSTPDSGSAPDDAGTHPGSAMGSLDGRAFRVASAWLIGAPDDPKQTRVIYVFDRAVKCGEITKPGWDETVADGTKSLEMKLIGTKPANTTFRAMAGRPPARPT